MPQTCIQSDSEPETLRALRHRVRSRLTCPLVIIGMMGAGKTRIGRLLASELDLDFRDADQEIETSAGCRISDIFELYGEPAFRDLEKKVITRLIRENIGVISTGGGAVTIPELSALLFSDSVVSLWIRADEEILIRRAVGDPDRPMLKGEDPAQKVRALLAARAPLYERANIVIDTHEGPHAGTVRKALESLDAYLSER